ncbi:MAG: hypothetical protein GQ533_04160 [Methanosarcinaceae archaeon]|nr:hypothetical protein [Methanosarcinaceae archaeon]
MLQRFKKLNQGKQYKEQIKPFSFFNVGFQTIQEGNKLVKPLAPFSTDSQRMVHEPFIDYQTGEIKQGVKYFKPLSKTILQYVDHPESKFEGDIGILERKHIQANEVVHIGKEANNIDEQTLKGQGAQVFKNEEELNAKILALIPKEAREFGVSRSVLNSIKNRIRSGRKINFKPTQ